MNQIDKYINQHNDEIKKKMIELVELIRAHVPESTTETIKWAMPTFVYYGNLIHFASAKNHVGLYPGSDGVKFLESELIEKGYKYSKGAIQLPLNKPLDVDMIIRLLEFQIQNNESD